MAFFILSTSKIILIRSWTALGSFDLVPALTVSFLTASSSYWERVGSWKEWTCIKGTYMHKLNYFFASLAKKREYMKFSTDLRKLLLPILTRIFRKSGHFISTAARKQQIGHKVLCIPLLKETNRFLTVEIPVLRKYQLWSFWMMMAER